MKVLLISANTERLNMPTMPVGLACVAAATRKDGHETFFLDLMRQTDPADAIRTRIASFHPDVIGISVRNIDDQSQSNPRFLLEQVKDVVEVCRASSKAPLVLGGAGYSMFPDAVLEYLGADWGVCGDGEKTFVDLLDRLEHGLDPSSLPGVHTAGHRAITTGVFAQSGRPALAGQRTVGVVRSEGPRPLDTGAEPPRLSQRLFLLRYQPDPGTGYPVPISTTGGRSHRPGSCGRFPQILLRGQLFQYPGKPGLRAMPPPERPQPEGDLALHSVSPAGE